MCIQTRLVYGRRDGPEWPPTQIGSQDRPKSAFRITGNDTTMNAGSSLDDSTGVSQQYAGSLLEQVLVLRHTHLE